MRSPGDECRGGRGDVTAKGLGTGATVILNGIDINRGNKQIAHAIDRVLLPVDL